MQTLILRVLILAFLAGALALAHSWNTGVLLHLKPQEDFNWEDLEAQPKGPEEGNPATTPTPTTPPEGEQPDTGETKPPETPVTQPKTQPETQPETQPSAGETQQPNIAPPPATPALASNEITVQRAKQLFDAQFVGAQQVIFIDARARDIYQQGHIEGAMSLPAGELGPQLPAKVRNYLPGSLVVIYCQGAECHDSHDVAKRLQAANLDIKPIFIFKDGYPAWTAAGYPTMTGPEVGWE